MGRRRPGSVRFDPYCKIQWYDERSLAWRDVQHAYPGPEAARLAARLALAEVVAAHPDGSGWAGRWRLMQITEQGRAPLPEEEALPCPTS